MVAPSLRASGTPRDVTSMLASYKSTRRSLHGRITGTLLVSGSALTFGGFAVDLLFEEGVIGKRADATWLVLAWSTGFCAFARALQPTFKIPVRVMCVLLSIFILVAAIYALVNLSTFIQVFQTEQPYLRHTRDLLFWSFITAFWVPSSVFPALTLRWDFTRRRFKVPCRMALRRLWIIIRFGLGGFACATVVTAIMNGLILQPQCERMSSSNTTMEVAMASTCLDDLEGQAPPYVMVLISAWLIVLIISTSPMRRGKFISLLGRLLLGNEVQSAATIASMLPGGKSAEKTISTALKKFRSLPFAALTVQDLATNKDTGLQNKTIAARSDGDVAGSVSAFMSHSWSDPAESKFKTLSQWAHAREEARGETATLWLECATLAHAKALLLLLVPGALS